MSIMTKKLLTLSLLTATSVMVACGSEPKSADVTPQTVEVTAPEVTMPDVAVEPTIVGLAVATPDLSTLVAAVTAAELVDTLNGDGPFTVFAPTNSAFAKLPAGTVESLVLPENKSTLTSILTYHVIADDIMAEDLVDAILDAGGTFAVTTVNGTTLTASIVDGVVVLTDATGATAKVVGTDIEASNGLVHVIDTVLMPK